MCRRISPLDPFLARAVNTAAYAMNGATNDIVDPLYGNSGDDGERSRLEETLAHLAHCCNGLLNYLTELQRRWGLHPEP